MIEKWILYYPWEDSDLIIYEPLGDKKNMNNELEYGRSIKGELIISLSFNIIHSHYTRNIRLSDLFHPENKSCTQNIYLDKKDSDL